MFKFQFNKMDVNKIQFSFSLLFVTIVNPVKTVIGFKVNSNLLIFLKVFY